MRCSRYKGPIKTVLRGAGLGCVLTIGLTGCRHKPVLPPLPPVIQPVPLISSPQPDPPPMIPPVQVDLPPVPVASGATPHRERRRRAAGSPSSAAPLPPAASSAADTPTTPPSEDAAIGALSLGGEASPQAQKEATDLIASIQRRLKALSSRKGKEDRAQISRIRNFAQQAQQALDSGDVEGAKTLATKARLLLDDLEK